MSTRTCTYVFPKKLLYTGFALMSGMIPAAAQEAAAGIPATENGETVFIRYMSLIALAFFAGILLFFVSTINDLLKAIIETQLKDAAKTSPEAIERFRKIAERPSVWKQFLQKITDAKPVEKEADILLDHEYDGIRELDNHLPPWWKWGFYLSIVFSVVYIINYHISPIFNEGLLQTAEYETDNAKAEQAIAEYRLKAADMVDENNVVRITDAAALEKGKSKYIELCAACHGDAGQGGIGPNLTDQYWLHGGDIKSVFSTIKYGVLDKGMIAWKDELKPSDMQAVTSYILSLQGTNPAGAKEPQGEFYVPAPETETGDSTVVNAEAATAKL